MEKMDHLMAEKITKIIKTAKWCKSHQKIILKSSRSPNMLSKIKVNCWNKKIEKIMRKKRNIL